jgi:hypothetical protein
VILSVKVVLRVRHVKPLNPIVFDNYILDAQGSVDGETSLYVIIPLAIIVEVHSQWNRGEKADDQ